MPDTRHYPPIPMPTTDPLSMHRTLLALKESVELLAGTRGNASAEPMTTLRRGTMAAAPFRLPVYNGKELPDATRYPSTALLARDNGGAVRLLVSDGMRWREANGVVYMP